MSTIDVIIAVHTTQRPIRRAVESALAASRFASVIVVAHGIDPDQISVKLVGLDSERIRVMGHVDGVASPAGPFNAGVAAATATYVVVLGSDDELEPGALDAAQRRLLAADADICILPLRHADGVRVESPLVRPGRAGVLDVVRDRIFSRTAPLCLMRREVAHAAQPLFDPRFRSGEDIAAGVRLWTGWRSTYHRTDPGYVIHDDATDRVTAQASLDVCEALEAPSALASEEWVAALAPDVRQSLAAKMIRVHLLGILSARNALREDEMAAAHSFIEAWIRLARGALRSLPRVERSILDAIRHGDAAAVGASIARRDEVGVLARVVTRNPLRSLDRDGVLRRYLAYRAYRRQDGH